MINNNDNNQQPSNVGDQLQEMFNMLQGMRDNLLQADRDLNTIRNTIQEVNNQLAEARNLIQNTEQDKENINPNNNPPERYTHHARRGNARRGRDGRGGL